MYIVIHDLDCFVLLCIDIWLNTLSVFMVHELDFSWVKIVTMAKTRRGVSDRRVTHVAQKPQLSEHVANRYLDSFRTSEVRKTERNVVIIDAVRYHSLSTKISKFR